MKVTLKGYKLVTDIIFQVQGSEKALAYHSRHLARFCCRFMIKGYGFAQGIYNDVTILAFGDMAIDLFTQFFT
jgi:hypothetical protein